MSYDLDFYQRYEAYLDEQSVRRAHEWCIVTLTGCADFQRVVDLGCGRSQEFLRRYQPSHYLGIDLEVEPDPDIALIKGNYRSLLDADADIRRAILDFAPTAFVSLFSTELTQPWQQNQFLYNELFSMCPTLECGLVSGLYYASKKDQPTIQAAGGLTYQTLETLEDTRHQVFEERRTILNVPSEMFGDEYEVWKLLLRRP